MFLRSKRLLGITAALFLGSAPAWADDINEAGGNVLTPAQLRQMVVKGGGQSQLAPKMAASSQQSLSVQQQMQLRNVQKSLAVVVRIPKDASGKELPNQAQVRLRLRDMVKSGQSQNIEGIWNGESIVIPNTSSNEMDSATTDEHMSNEWWARPAWGWGWGGFRPGFGWGFRPGILPGFRPWGWNGFVPRPYFGAPQGFYGFNAPVFYGAPAFNYYYYPFAGFNPYCC